MITSIRLINFKAHRDTSIGLGRFTALVGDNASGKTSVLEALALLGAMDPSPIDVLRDWFSPADVVRRGCELMRLVAAGRQGDADTLVDLELRISPSPKYEFSAKLKASRGSDAFTAEAQGRDGSGGSHGDWDKLRQCIGTVTLYEMNAHDVAGVSLVDDPGANIDGTGANTGAVLTALKLTDDAVFERIEGALRQLVPTVERVRLKQVRVDNDVVNRIFFDFRGAANVPAHGASQGTLVLLALLTVLHGPGRPNLVLLDDFEHTLHPRAQMELVRLIKSLLALDEFADVQIVATTHSPYVLDEMDIADVHAFAVGDDGCVRSKPLSAHPEAERSKGTLTAGQLWSLDPERAWVLKE